MAVFHCLVRFIDREISLRLSLLIINAKIKINFAFYMLIKKNFTSFCLFYNRVQNDTAIIISVGMSTSLLPCIILGAIAEYTYETRHTK